MKKDLGYDPKFKFSEGEREALWRIIRQKFGPKKGDTPCRRFGVYMSNSILEEEEE